MATNDIPVGSLKPITNGIGSGPPEEKKEKKPITPAATATIKEKTLAQKFKETFVKEDFKSIGKNLLKEKIFPELMGLIVDTISEGLSRHFGLNYRGSSGYSSGQGYGYKSGYTNYAQVSSYAYSKPQQKEEKKEAPGDYRSIRYYTKDDAESVLYSLKAYAKEYEQSNVSVADLYSFSSLTSPSFTDHNYGWSLAMLEKTKAVMVREDGENKWYLTLPNPMPID